MEVNNLFGGINLNGFGLKNLQIGLRSSRGRMRLI